MHLNFNFNAVQVLWTLTFAAHLVVLVVLLGRDRVRRFPWFTTAIALVALRLVASRLLYGRLPQITLGGIFIVLADVSAVVALLVLVEMARRAFSGAERKSWALWCIVVFVIGAAVLAVWGIWPSLKSLAPSNTLATLGLLQLLAQKLGLLVDVMTIELGLLVVAFGRRYGAGWRTHTQQIVVGLSTVSIAQLAVQGIWQLIAKSAAPHSMAEYERTVGLRDKLVNGNSAVYLAATLWWIVCLWIDEPGSAPVEAEALPVETGEPAEKELDPVDLPKEEQD